MPYAGRVYDGPWKGRSHTSERPWFEIPMRSALNPGMFSYRGEYASPVAIKTGFYRWSRPLRAWVFCGDQMPRLNFCY